MAEEPKKQKARRPTAAKRHLQSLKRNVRNRACKSQIKTCVKTLRGELKEKSLPEAQKSLSELYSLVDKAVKKGIIKPNKASRTKSRLASQLSKAA